MAREPKKYNEIQIREFFKKKSYPYRVSLLTQSLKAAINDGGVREEIHYIAEAMGFTFVDGFSEPKWIENQK
jgi:hypothetical protein